MIRFTQFLRPDGRRRETAIQRSPAIETLAAALVLVGAQFEIEELQNGVVSMEILLGVDDEGEPRTLAHELCRNGPSVPDMVDTLVQRAHLRMREASQDVN